MQTHVAVAWNREVGVLVARFCPPTSGLCLCPGANGMGQVARSGGTLATSVAALVLSGVAFVILLALGGMAWWKPWVGNTLPDAILGRRAIRDQRS